MRRLFSIVVSLSLTALFSAGCKVGGNNSSMPLPVRYDEIDIKGELSYRLQQSFDVLNSSESQDLAILALVTDASASRKASQKLNEIISAFPSHLNGLGYIGSEDSEPDERTFADNGLILRGLCAYYNMSSNGKALDWIRSVASGLFVRNKEVFMNYSLAPGLEGLVEAYRLVGTPEMKEVIDSMATRFLETDLAAVKAGTHASLSACRGLISYAEITGDPKWVAEAESRWNVYKEYGMTENYGSYTQMGLYEGHADPSATADSYILALKLWQHTRKSEYLKEAQLIYYNALCHVQRGDGSFGLDTCPGEASGTDLSVVTDEPFPMGTMSGAEGLATAAACFWMREGNTFYVTNPRSSTLSAEGLELEMTTEYPFEGILVLDVKSNLTGSGVNVKVYVPDWMLLSTIQYDGKILPAKVGDDGFLTFEKLKTGDRVLFDYSFSPRQEPVVNVHNTKPGQARYFSGPFILNEEGTPVYHLMDTTVTKASGYHHQILFNGF